MAGGYIGTSAFVGSQGAAYEGWRGEQKPRASMGRRPVGLLSLPRVILPSDRQQAGGGTEPG